MKQHLLLAVFLLFVSGPAIAPAQTASPGAIHSTGQQLSGSWIMTLNLPGGALPVKLLVTYLTDGGFIATQADKTQQHGNWIRTGDRQFATTSYYFRTDTDGNFVGSVKIRAALQLNDGLDSISGTLRIEVLDPTGGLLAAQDSLPLTQQLIVVEPLPTQ